MKHLYKIAFLFFSLFCLAKEGLAQVNLPATLTFSSNDPGNWSDGIAQDGEGSSSNINGLDLEIYATDASFNLLPGSTIVWHDNSYLASNTPGYNAITPGPDVDVTNNGIPGMVIKSSSTTVNFALQSMQLYDWGGTPAVTVAAYDNGGLLGSVDVNFNQSTWEASNVSFDPATFGSVDELRFYPAASSGMPVMWLSMNNIALAAPTSTLPVTFASFAARLSGGNSVVLNWQTATELDAEHFEVERSLTGNSFERVGEVAAHGSMSLATSYQFLYNGPLSAKTFFRLKQVDKDGRFNYSKTVSVASEDEQQLQLAPNPVQSSINITSADIISHLDLFTASGLRIRSMHVNGRTATMDLTALPKGVYFIAAQLPHGTIRRTVIRQ